jgi:tRNA(Met) C34 N-acetyltransferase TmcA
MKHKPMLLNKLSRDKRGRFREVIGLIGTHHGVGVTHTGLLLAFYFGEELGKKTALIECNGHRDMQRIEQAYEWGNEVDNYFSFHQITCYKEVKLSQIPQILGEDYEYVILDFGTDFTSNREELLRCSTKIVVGGQSEWDILKLKEFIRNTEVIRGSEHWICYLVRAKEQTIQRLKKELKQRIWAVPDIKEPTRISYKVRLFLKQCFSLG